jgi:uncharacterized protein (DUF983 family)
MTYASYPLGLTAADFPVQSPALRRAIIIDHERCPQCGGFLDTGNECNDCGFDAMPEYTREPIPT